MTIATVAVLAYNIPKSCNEDRELESDAAETPGTVIKYERYGRGNHYSVFSYTVDGVAYTTSSSAETFKDCISSQWCIGERYVIRYWRPNPERAKVMWDKPLPRLDTLNHQ